MRLLSIDIETTGLNERTCQVIEIGAIIDSVNDRIIEPPTFHCYVEHNSYVGEPYALSMHPEIFRDIALSNGYILGAHEVWFRFSEWLRLNEEWSDNGKWTITGKNYAGFDDRFLRLLPGWNSNDCLRRRILDPGSLWWKPGEPCLPDTAECCRRAGIKDTVCHTALEDAKQVIELVQLYAKKQSGEVCK